jgi:hypothetical protein
VWHHEFVTLRMHEYESGRTGLAAFCDVCGDQITENGYVVWNGTDVSDWLVIHQARCDPGRPRYDMSMPLDVEIVYLANSASVDLDEARESVVELSQ